MGRYFVLTGILIGAGLIGCQPVSDPPSETEARAALQTAKVETWRALYRDNDVKGLEAFLADDFVMIQADGAVTTKLEILQDLSDNPWDMPEDFLYTVTGIVFPSSTSAIVFGHGDSSRIVDGQNCHHRYTSSNGFRYEADKWRPVSSHVSDASCK
ncbi:MAG: nuclear transport factor 2 family protein [Hellea sp.]|nr:nuclear transport factor 2 family protein [Hellea sp.]